MKTGLVRWEWHSLDHVAASESQAPVPTTRRRGTGFTSTRSSREPNGDVLISARSTWATYQLEGGTGEIVWRLGGTKSSFTMGPGAETAWQHDARMLPDGDDHAVRRRLEPADPLPVARRAHRARPGDPRRASRASYTHPGGPLLADSQGNMQTLADGSTRRRLGRGPERQRARAPTARCCSTRTCPPDMSSYRAFRFPWSGHPLSAAGGARRAERHW